MLDIPDIAFPLTGVEILTNLAVAVACGLFIAWLYRHTYKGPGYSLSFVNSLVILSMVTAVVLMVIGNNLARAFGLVGAMSIIRFRTAVKDPQDIVYVFFALSTGMAAGVGYYKLAIIGTLAVSTMMFLFARTQVTAGKSEEYLLQFSYSPNGDEKPAYLPVFRKYCRRHTVINTRSVGVDEEDLELSYYVKFKDLDHNGKFVRELNRTDGVRQVNLYFDEEQF